MSGDIQTHGPQTFSSSETSRVQIDRLDSWKRSRCSVKIQKNPVMIIYKNILYQTIDKCNEGLDKMDFFNQLTSFKKNNIRF